MQHSSGGGTLFSIPSKEQLESDNERTPPGTTLVSEHPFPFHRLPSELLIAIFQAGERSSRGYERRFIPFPVLVSHVCRHWRGVALDVAILWADIRIYDARLTQARDLAHMYLQRSKSSLLHVSYHSHGSSSSSTTAFVQLLTSDLLPHIHRVRQLTIMVEADRMLSSAMAILKDVAAPSLESLRISLIEPTLYEMTSPDSPIAAFHPIFIRGAPLLRSIQLSGLSRVPWPEFTRLTSLTLKMQLGDGVVSLKDFFDVLTNISQTLIRLKVWEVCFDSDPMDLHLPPVELPVLKSLNLIAVLIFPSLHTPNLENLYMSSADSITLDTFCARCSSSELSTLQSLKFDESDLALFKDKVAVVRGLPSLTELIFWSCFNENCFLSLLEEDDDRSKATKKKAKKRSKRPWKTRTLTDSVVGSHALSPSPSQGSLGTEVHSSAQPIESDIMPNLRSVTISEGSSWPLLRSILLNRKMKGKCLLQVRFPEVNDKKYNQMKSWLAERNVDYEEYDPNEGRAVPDPDDREWVEEEECFELDAEEGEEYHDWSDEWSGDDGPDEDNNYWEYDDDDDDDDDDIDSGYVYEGGQLGY